MIRTAFVLILAAAPACAQEILEPKPDAVVASPVTIAVHCGDPCTDGRTHMHVLVDTAAPKAGEMIQFDAHHLHVHERDAKLKVELPPGRHTVQLLLGSGRHVAKSDGSTKPVAFTVK